MDFQSVLINYDTFKYTPEPLKDFNAFIDSLDNKPYIVVVVLTEARYEEETEEQLGGTVFHNWVFAYRTGSTCGYQPKPGDRGKGIKEQFKFYGDSDNYWPTTVSRWPFGDEPHLQNIVFGVVGVIKDMTRDHEDEMLGIINTMGKGNVRGKVYPCGQIL